MNSCTQDEEFEGECVNYRCRQCGKDEEIPLGAIEYFHILDPGDPTVPPRFSCEHCGGEMWPTEDWEALVHGESFDSESLAAPSVFFCEHCGGEMCCTEDWEEEAEQLEWSEEEEEKLPTQTAPIYNTNKIGRNDPCLCGSGKKYKRCCGKS